MALAMEEVGVVHLNIDFDLVWYHSTGSNASKEAFNPHHTKVAPASIVWVNMIWIIIAPHYSVELR